MKKSDIFPAGTRHRAVVVATYGKAEPEQVLLWEREQRRPSTVTQRFGTVSASARSKRAFMAELEDRRFGETLVMLCGESGIIRTQRESKAIVDEHGFFAHPAFESTRLVLNPIHNYMVRHEMNLKRAAYSRGRRYCLSVWNAGDKKIDAAAPWRAFYDGRDVTDRIEEIEEPAWDVASIRIGILDVT